MLPVGWCGIQDGEILYRAFESGFAPDSHFEAGVIRYSRNYSFFHARADAVSGSWSVSNVHQTRITVRLFPAAGLLAAFPVLFAIWRLHKRRTCKEAWECKVCDYNLTGNQSGVCPECGTAVKPGLERPKKAV